MTPPMNYVEPPDIPEGMTCREYRRLRHPVRQSRRARSARLLARLRRRPRPAGKS